MELFANVMPEQLAEIPWGWRNRQTQHGPMVIEHPGRIQMPKLSRYFDWTRYRIEDYAPGRPFGTRNMKSVFVTASRFMGWEELLVQSPPLDPIVDGFLEWNARLCDEWGARLEYFMIGDETAYNRGLLINPDWWRSWIKPHYAKMVSFAKSRKMTVVFHADGDLWDVLDDFAEIGVDVLNYQAVGRMVMVKESGKTNHRGMAFMENEETARVNRFGLNEVLR